MATIPLTIRPGQPLPLGATVNATGVNFSLFSQNATSVDLLVFDRADDLQPSLVVPITVPTLFYWHAQVDGLRANSAYAFRVNGPSSPADLRRFGHRFNPRKVLIDPYARGNVKTLWSAADAIDDSDNLAASMRSVVIDLSDYDWEGDVRPNRSLADTVIYELHVRGYTRSPSSGVAQPGTFAGLVEKLPYIKGLGITAVELMPVFDFDEKTAKRASPTTGAPLTNLALLTFEWVRRSAIEMGVLVGDGARSATRQVAERCA